MDRVTQGMTLDSRTVMYAPRRDLEFVNGAWVIAERSVACGDGTRSTEMPASLVERGCGN